MKWAILALILFRQVMTLPAADLSIKVYGTVHDIISGIGVTDQEVSISVENFNPPIYYVSHVKTDDTGFYFQQFFLPLNYGQIVVSTFDCETNLIERSFIFSFENNSFNADFNLCSNANIECSSIFNYQIHPENPLIVQFFDQSPGTVHKWDWIFGDGTTSTLQNPVHQFGSSSVYLVCLTITDTLTQCSSTYCDYIAIESISSCNANYIFLPVLGNDLQFQFIDQSVGNPDNWHWSFGDGQFSIEKNPVHQFEQPGLYNVCISISNQEGDCVDDYCKYLLINENPPCKAYFTYQELSVDPYSLRFSDSSFGNIAFWHWNFGDGETSEQQNPIHVYYDVGAFEVCLTMTDTINDCSHTYCETIFVGITRNCEASFGYSQTYSEDNIIEFFDGSVGDIASRLWTFGDGTTSNEQNPVHEFPGPGNYLTCLEISNNVSDCIDSYCLEIEIQNDISCFCDFDFIQDSLNPFLFSFSNYSSLNSNFYIWEFGDGSYSTEVNPMHQYSKPGFYKVCLISGDSLLLCFDQTCKNVILENATLNCHADFSFETSASPDVIQFFDESDGLISEWYWDFGDGNFSTEYNPLHTYMSEGDYQVCFSIGNPNTNCTDLVCKELPIVFPDPCIAQFSYNIDGSNPLKVMFTNSSTGNFTTQFWNFGDGQVSTQTNPVHIFSSPGDFNVCLTVRNQDELRFCDDTLCKSVFLSVPLPECKASFSYILDTLSGMKNHYLFKNDSQGLEPEYKWSFSNGLEFPTQNVDIQFEQSGSYQVKLVVKTTDIWGQMCIDSVETMIQTPIYHNLAGLLFAGEYPINNPESTYDTAQIFLYKIYLDQIVPVDTIKFTELGYFYFPDLRQGNYIIKSLLVRGSARYQNYIPSYFGGAINWEEAELINLDADIYTADIHLPESTRFLLASGSISGNVNIDYHHLLFPFNTKEGITVYLMDEAGKTLVSDITDFYGRFYFSSLKTGTYSIRADVTGLKSTSVSVVLNESSFNQTGIIIDVYFPSQVGFDESMILENDFLIYPNPATTHINIKAIRKSFENINVAVRSVLGNIVKEAKTNLKPGDPFTLDLGSLPAGLYYVEVFNKEGLVETRKLLKNR